MRKAAASICACWVHPPLVSCLSAALCQCASVPASLPVYLSANLLLPSGWLSPSVFINLSSLAQSVDLFLGLTHPSTYLSLFPICLFRHLSPPHSSELAVCREKCLARVNGSAVNTSEGFCSALSAAAAPFRLSEHAHAWWAHPQLERSRLNVWDKHRSSVEVQMNMAPFKRSVHGADEFTARIFIRHSKHTGGNSVGLILNDCKITGLIFWLFKPILRKLKYWKKYIFRNTIQPYNDLLYNFMK